jgi:DNA gyrase/topoisomerase IV subunit A
MTFSEKIEEWIKEAETRPGSALMILQLVAGRLRDLTERNEQLLAENIALQNGKRVEEYQKRISHLEFQLEMLKHRFGGDLEALPEAAAGAAALNLLVYNAQGRILRLELGTENLAGSLVSPGRITGEIASGGEFPRLLVIEAGEQALLLFSTGRISTCAVESIPAVPLGGSWSWEDAALPDEPHAGELLACVLPLARLPLADFILQVSRKGSLKKTLVSMSESIISNKYLGRGALQKADQAFDAGLCSKKERIGLVTYEGRVLALNVDDLSYAAEERIRLDASDFVVASFVLREKEALVCLTQTGKVIQRDGSMLEPAKSGQSRGQGLIPPARLEQGTRFIGAAAAGADDRLLVLGADGSLTIHQVRDLAGAGAIRGGGIFLSMGLLAAPRGKGAA